MKLISFERFRNQCYLFNRYPTAFTVFKDGYYHKTTRVCKLMNPKTGKFYLCTAKTCPYFKKLKDYPAKCLT